MEVREDTADRVELLLRGDLAGEWILLRVGVEPDPPHRVGGIGLGPGSPPEDAARDEPWTDDEIRAEMTSLLQRLVDAERFSGTVRMVRGDEVVFEAVHGEANKDFGVPNRMDTRFNLGSMNKMFTAVGVALLVERGEMAYEDALVEYLPDFPDPESAAKIRIEHLLTHTSGLASYVGYDRQTGPDGPVWRNNLFQHVIRGGPAGGGYSTVGDLVRFAEALRDGTLVSAETLELLTTPKPELGSDEYGYGFGIYPDGGAGHSGGFPGINSELVFWPDGEWTLAVMSNYSGGAQPVMARMRQLVTAGR